MSDASVLNQDAETTEITQSGLYQDNLGQQFLVTQGLSGYTLVDGKRVMFRLFMTSYNLGRLTAIHIKVRDSSGTVVNVGVPRSRLLIENSAPNGPSAGFALAGVLFLASRQYTLEFNMLAGDLSFARVLTPQLKFNRAGTMRILVKNLIGNAPWGNRIEPDQFWPVEITNAMSRLEAMLPIRDGWYWGSNNNLFYGLGLIKGQDFDAWPSTCPSGNPPSEPDPEFPSVKRCPGNEMNNACVAEAKQLRSQGIRVDVTVAWRPRDTRKYPPAGGEDAGGQAPSISNDRLATVCGGYRNGIGFTAPIVAQEVGHTFGLEPRESPHYDGGAHSKDPSLVDPFAFDMERRRSYYPPPSGTFLGDVMSYAWSQGRDSTLYNAYDWEYIRRKLVQISAVTNADEQSAYDKTIEDEVTKVFETVPKIEVENPDSTLTPKPGFEWHWTESGFRLLTKEKSNSDNSGLAASARSILDAMRRFDVKEFYAPVEGKPFHIVLGPEEPITCYGNDVRSSGLL